MLMIIIGISWFIDRLTRHAQATSRPALRRRGDTRQKVRIHLRVSPAKHPPPLMRSCTVFYTNIFFFWLPLHWGIKSRDRHGVCVMSRLTCITPNMGSGCRRKLFIGNKNERKKDRSLFSFLFTKANYVSKKKKLYIVVHCGISWTQH